MVVARGSELPQAGGRGGMEEGGFPAIKGMGLEQWPLWPTDGALMIATVIPRKGGEELSAAANEVPKVTGCSIHIFSRPLSLGPRFPFPLSSVLCVGCCSPTNRVVGAGHISHRWEAAYTEHPDVLDAHSPYMQWQNYNERTCNQIASS